MILVTGGAGYVGGHFLRTFLAGNKDTEVVVVDNLSEGHQRLLPARGIHFFKEDIGNVPAIEAIVSRFPIEAIVHFAASAYVGESQSDPFKYFGNNVAQSLKLFEAMERRGVTKIVFSSTCATYGNPQYVPLDEKHPQCPVNVYGTTKLMVEQALKALANSRGWSCIFLRYFNAAGAHSSGEIGEDHQPETHLIPLALKVASGELESVKIYGNDYETPDGTCIRDYIHVTDLARAHLRALDLVQKQQMVEGINLGTEKGASVKEVIDRCENVTGKKIATTIAPRRPGDPPVLVANAKRAQDLLNWRAQFDLEGIIHSAWQWHSQNAAVGNRQK